VRLECSTLNFQSGPVDDSILIDEADPDTIPIDDLASDVSLDEDAVPVRKVTANNKVSSSVFLGSETEIGRLD
jgi:hypothetical protein